MNDRGKAVCFTGHRKLTNIEIENLFEKYKEELKLETIEEKKWKKKCVTIIEFNNLETIEDISIPNYTPLDDWIMVNDLEELKTR